MRPSKRKNNELRQILIESPALLNNKASCIIKMGGTHVICTASLDENVPKFLRNKGAGWLTAEYGMLPCSSSERIKREVSQGKPSGRTQEIQRLIGRSLRSALDMSALGERQIIIDCDVINADGGTRCASITGGYVALHLLIRELINNKTIKSNPLKYQIAAVSCGIYNGTAVADLDYAEDSTADIDGNFVFTSNGSIIEVQTSSENTPCSEDLFQEMFKLAKDSANQLFALQNKTLLSL